MLLKAGYSLLLRDKMRLRRRSCIEQRSKSELTPYKVEPLPRSGEGHRIATATQKIERTPTKPITQAYFQVTVRSGQDHHK